MERTGSFLGTIAEFLKRRPFLGAFFGQRVALEEKPPLTPEQRALMEKFRKGIAEALGVPPEMIKEERLEKWIREWTKAWVKPTYPAIYGEKLGEEIVAIIKEAERR